MHDVSNVFAEPLASLLEEQVCAVLYSVQAPADSVCYVAVTNPPN